MKITINLLFIFISLLLINMLLTGCLEKEDTKSLYSPYDESTGLKVTVTTIVPEVAGSTSEITINGSGFSDNVNANRVYFNSFEYDAPNEEWLLVEVIQADVKSSSENQLVIYRPGISGDSIQIKVVNINADEFGTYSKNYPIENIFKKHGNLNPTDKARTMGVDSDDNIYLRVDQTSEVIMKWTDAGSVDTNFVIIEDVGNIFSINEGPDDYMYYLKKGRSNKSNLLRFPKTGGSTETYQSGLDGTFNSFDFDINGNAIFGGRDAIGVMNPDFTFSSFDYYQDYEIKSVKVFNGYVYVLAVYTGSNTSTNASGIYKNQIMNTSGQLGDKELIVSRNNTGDYQSSIYNALTLDEDGYIYVVTDNENPIMGISPTGEVSSIFYGVLNPVMNEIIWGAGNFVYILENTGQIPSLGGGVRRIDMGKNGAPYFGRDL